MAGVLVLSAVLRAWLLPIPALEDDMEILAKWGVTLRGLPFGEFYTNADPECDYPPVYLYILWATMKVASLFVGAAAYPERLAIWLKLAPVAADLALGLVAFLLCRRFLGPGWSLAATTLVLFSPGLAFVSAVWGQVDSVPNALAMASLLALISGRPNIAAALAGLGLLVKPQYLLFLLGPAVAYLRSETLRLPPAAEPGAGIIWARWLGWRVLVPVAVLIATVQLSMLPFSVSLWPMGSVEWTLWERLGFRAAKFALTSVGAFNLWATPLAGTWLPDSGITFLSLSYQTWGYLLMLVAVLPALVLAWRKPNDPVAVLWSGFLVYLAFFVLTTRIHERYLFPAIPLVAVASAFRLWIAPFYLVTSGLYFANLWVIYHTQPSGPGRLEASQYAGLIPAVSILAVGLLVAALAAVLVLLRTSQAWKGGLWWNDDPAESGRGLAPPGPVALLARLIRSSRHNLVLASVLALMLLAGGFGAGFLSGVASGAGANGVHTVRIRAQKLWQDTGVQAIEGRQYLISAKGDWTNKRGTVRFGPEGGTRSDESTIMPQVPIGVLIGRTGDSAPLVVGGRAVVTAASSGPLRLVMNDWPDDRNDAQGSITVEIISVQP